MTELLIVLGSLISISGILVAIIQTLRIKRIKHDAYLNIWLSISQLRSVQNKLGRHKNEDVSLAKAYEATLHLIRLQLKRAAQFENNFNEETIEKWVELEKLPNDAWYIKQSKNYIK